MGMAVGGATAGLVSILLLGCGEARLVGDGTSTSTGELTTTAGESSDTGTPTGPCPLEGMFVDCQDDDTAGIAYCDLFEDGLQWGPCVESPACELGTSFEGCPCTLVDGRPTIVSADGCCANDADLTVCPQTSCVQRWDYSCAGCESFSTGDCFSFDHGCAAPTLECALDMPCLPVLALPDEQTGQLGLLEDAPAAPCMLEALRDGTPGVYEVGWGESYGAGWITEQVYAPGDGTVFTQWQFDCPACTHHGTIGRTGVMSLRSADYFDECLAATANEDLIQCIVGFLEFEPDTPPPQGYLPPFVTGECTSLEPSCP
jgi:hypothetical protein